MKSLIKIIADLLDDSLFRYLVKYFYPQYRRPRIGYKKNYQILNRYFFYQKIIGINRKVKWPVHRTSTIISPELIIKGICCDPGDNPGIFINASGGLKMGNNVNIGPNTIIVTANHDKYDHRKVTELKGVSIGNNVWIGANCSILAGAQIGDEVTIGAGCVINGTIPSKTTVTVNSDINLKIKPKSGEYVWDCTQEKLI